MASAARIPARTPCACTTSAPAHAARSTLTASGANCAPAPVKSYSPSAWTGAHTVTRTPRAASPVASDRTWELQPAPPPSTWTVRSGCLP